MNRKLKLAATFTLAVLFGIIGFNTAIPAIATQSVNFAFGALLPFLICAVAFLDQFTKYRKERRLA